MSYAIRSGHIAKTQSRNYAKLLTAVSAATVGSLCYYNYTNNSNNRNNNSNNNNNNGLKALFGLFTAKQLPVDTNVRLAGNPASQDYYQKVYNAIAQKLVDVDDYDYGSYAPLLLRLAWHNSGSYDQNDPSDKKGGSFAGTMRFDQEKHDPENAGLNTGVEFLRSIKDEFPDISYGDLFTLGGVVAVQEMQGPKIPWHAGRIDLPLDVTPPYGRLPDASQTTGSYIREVFTDRLAFTDEELVALIGVGHSVGRCHVKNSGFDGPWTFSPTTISNQFFQLLLSEDWKFKKWDGKKQYEDEGSHSLMMLPADFVLKTDPKFVKYVEIFAKDEDKCMKVFASAFSKLIERGCAFNQPAMVFKTLEEQEN